MRYLSNILLNATRVTALCGLTLMAVPVSAQNIFSPAATVNASVITEFEVAQRQRFLTLLNAPGSGRDAVLDELIDEKLRDQAIRDAGFEATEEEIQAGMEEFASRVNLPAEEFVAVLEENGVAEASFRAFVTSGIGWRSYVRARFGPRTQVSEAQIDRALGTGGNDGNVRVLLSEIIIPSEPGNRAQIEELAQQIAATESAEEFSDFAREFSASPSRDNGGRLPWRALDELPPQLRPLLLALAPGETSDPIPLPEAVAIFQLRDIQETGAPRQAFAAIDYAAYFLPGGRSAATLEQAAGLRNRIDQCDDLFGEALGQPVDVLDRGSRAPSEIPADIAQELSRLDPGEVSTALTRNNGQTLVFLMLCGRTAAVNEELDRAEAAGLLRQSRINAYADSLVAQLRADARIEVR
ncbi:MAG: peptidylprolyl isomerase [Pseudomonadota bacterium]